jgi:hypothetical protein
VKALVWDGSGLWVCAKRLERGRFGWPAANGTRSIILRPEELAMLVVRAKTGCTTLRQHNSHEVARTFWCACVATDANSVNIEEKAGIASHFRVGWIPNSVLHNWRAN